MSLFPLFLKLEGRPCMVVGAGHIALSKIDSLLASGARVRVIAPLALPEIEAFAGTGLLEWHARTFEANDLDGCFLVIAATNQPDVNQAVYESAVARGVLCNSVDDPPHCDFYFGSVVERGDLQIAISTAGHSPALAQRLRHEIDEQLPQDLGPWLEQLGELRREILAAFPSTESRKQLLHTLAQRSLCESETCPSRKLAWSALEVARREASA